MIKRVGGSEILHSIVEHGGVIYLSGITADDTSGGMSEQAADICRKIDGLLAEVGSDRTKLLTAQIFITDMSEKPAMNAVWTKWLAPEHLPCRATIGVADLGPGIRIEIMVTAGRD
ncbi:RidA family protein [Propylenella binzhouense]|uniref:RidA family protein n=1 Tax=Propylenella binzhouense TaxID=2555902 RepID=A0A964WUY3_9HYPH|nr:RidA family protein [Propylenella binzhouense]MYZ49566.1 RidA family protein [Propylenella binzhouense]